MAIHYTFSTVNWQWNETIHNSWIKIIHTKVFVHYSYKFEVTKQHNKLTGGLLWQQNHKMHDGMDDGWTVTHLQTGANGFMQMCNFHQ